MRQQGGFFHLLKIIMVLAIVGAGFFCAKNAIASQSILISEVQVSGGPGKTGNDFIEIYNPTSANFNLKGHRLVKRTKAGATDTNIKSWTTDTFIPANGYYLWANSGYMDIAVMPNATTTATISDDNGIAIRFGAADNGIIIDSLAWGEAANAFIEGAVFPANPGANQSLERRSNLDTDSNGADFFIQTNPNPQNSGVVVTPPSTVQCGNGQVESGEQCDDGNLANGDSCSSICQAESGNPPNPLYQGGETAPASTTANQYNLGDMVINEFVSDPADNEVEWIELYNKTSRDIDLTGWWLEDGSSAKTKLTGVIGLSDSSRYKIIEKPTGVLNNAGDLMVLYDSSGKIIDQVAYGGWDDGNMGDNAPVAHDPDSVARKFDGYNSFNNANDFAATLKTTKGASNIIQAEDEISAEAKAKFDFSNDIFISEILPNPIGDDTKLEFIEIYNAGTREVNLNGWSLSNEDNKKVNLEKISTSAIIKIGEYLAVYRPKIKIVLHNNQGEVKLYQPLADKPAQIVAYKNVKEGWSYNLTDNPPNPCPQSFACDSRRALYQGGTNWIWSEIVTPGQANVVKQVNHAPEVEFNLPEKALVGQPIIFDSSDTDDSDGDSLKYAWDFGDGFKNSLANPEHTFFKIGIYNVKLAVSDGQATSTKEKSVRVVSSIGELDGVETPLTPLLKGGEEIPLNPPLLKGVIINEVFPDPTGADTGQEWLELKNQNQDRVNLINWRVENSNGKYKFKDDLWLDAANFYLLTNAVSKLAFKNSSDTVSLYNDLAELADTVEYANAAEGESYARGANGKWFWTTKVTPGEENVISLAESKSGIMNNELGIMGNADSYIETTLEKIRELEIGSLVRVKGAVAVEPGILGVQIFYIVNLGAGVASSTASSTLLSGAGIQIYNYKKDFPALKLGDYVEISGELAQTQDEFRIKTKTEDDIRIIGHNAALSALALSCDAVSEENIGQLITVSGEITDKKASTAYLDDGNGEILVYFKQGARLDVKNLKAGQAAAVTGILSKTSAGLRLLPRYQADIVKIDQPGQEPQVLGESIGAGEWAVAERDRKIELFKYLLIIAGGVIIVLAGLFIRVKKKV